MIARIWRAQALPANAPVYTRHFTTAVVPTLQRVPGYAGALLLNRETGDAVQILLVTFWHSLDSIRLFAGAEIGRAVVAEEAQKMLTSFETEVTHFEVVHAEGEWSPIS